MSSNNNLINFWLNDIWNINIDYIQNKKIKNIISQINKLNSQLISKRIFSIDKDLDIKINDKHEIKKKINKLKKDYIYYLKTHSDCIFEYHFVVQENIINKVLPSEEIDSILSEKENSFSNYDNYVKKINENYNSFNKYFENMDSNILIKLKKNIDNNLDNIYNFIKNSDKPILLIDTENILKSHRIQHTLLNYISKEEYEEYFNVWFYGLYKQYNNIDYSNCSNVSLTEYSSNIKYIEPYNSLNLSLKNKKNLISVIIKNYFQNYNVLSIITSNDLKDNIIFDLIEDNMLFIPIFYNKNDIREQDDHLLLFLYYHFRKIRINSKMITDDKFKWFPKKIHAKNIFYEYDFDNANINLIIQESNSNDVYTINNKKYKLIFINYPLLYIKYLKINNSESISNNYNSFDFNNTEIIFKSLVLIDILKKKYDDEFEKILNYYIVLSSKIYNKFSNIFTVLDKYSKKDIFNILLTNSDIFKSCHLNTFDDNIKIYKIILDSFIIIKSILYFQFQSLNNNFVLKIVKLATNIIDIYDEIETNIYKIRKLSHQDYLHYKIFLKLNSLFIYFKKNKYLKKNFK